MHSSILRTIASEYLNTSVTPSLINLWWSFPHPDLSPSSESAQLYHYDLDGFKWLKCFMYINDVSPGNGTHCFLPKTHIPGSKSQELLMRGYSRISDEDIAKFQSNEEIEISGVAGTIFLGDTKCFHKGKPLVDGKRLVFQVEYSANTFSQSFGN
jgi:hypothetical protein